MSKQTFTVGQVLTASQMTSLQQTAMGGGSTTAKTASYVLVAADAGTVVQMNAAGATTITVNTALFAAGDSVQIQNVGAGVCTVTAGTATVSTAGSLALSQYEGGQLYFNTTSAALFFDIVQSSGMTNPLTTTGDTIYSSSGTTPARLGIGSTGQVLTVASGLPSWATPSASASGLTKIVTANFSASAAVQISNCFDSTYVNYIIVLNALSNSGGGALYMNWMTGTNTVVNSGIYYAGGKSVTNGGTDTIFTNNNDTKFTIAPTIATATRQNFTINCSNVGNGSQDGNFSSLGNGSGNGIATTAGIIASSASTTGVQFTGNGNLTGTYTVYGLAK